MSNRFPSVLFFGLCSLPLLAQEPGPRGPAPAVPAPPDVPVADVTDRVAAPQAEVGPVGNANLRNTLITEPIDEPKLSGDALADLYRTYTGRRVIVTSAVSEAEFRFVQGASKKNPLTYAEAAELLRKAAVLEGFVFVQHPQDENLDILTLATGGPGPKGVGIPVHNENTPLPQSDIVITYVMTLDHIKPDQALNIFTQVIGQFGAYGSIAAVPNASAVIITEKASLIKTLIELKETIDVPIGIQSTRFIKVHYADVTEIATTLSDLLTAQQGTDASAGVQRTAPDGGRAVAGGAVGESTGGGESTPIQILPDPRTNRIFAMGRPVDLVFVEGLVREFDVPTDEKTFMRRKLRFLTVSEFLPIASDAITRAFSGTGEAGAAPGGGAAGSRTSSSSSNRSRTTTSSSNRSSFGNSSNSFGGNSSNSFGGSSNSFGGGNSGFGGGSGGGMGGNALGNPEINSAPESVLVGRTLLVADNITNSIVAQGPPSALEIIERLLDQIDVKPEQVMISTVIGQLTHDNSSELGVNYLIRGENFKGGGGAGPILPILTLPDGGGGSRFPVPDPQGLIGTGLRAYGTVDNLTYFVRALQERANFTVLSRPSIFTSNNQKGSISSGERIAIPTSTNSFAAGGASTNIEYQDVVLRLEVIPLVNSDNEITMQVALLNDEQNGIQTIQGAGSNGEDLSVPRISTREIITTVTIPNNDTIVLGGLIIGRTGTNKSGIPILSDIPYLGGLFGSTLKDQSRTELLVFMQPSIVKNATALTNVQDDFDNRYRISEDAGNFADGEGMLPGEAEENAPDFWHRMKSSPDDSKAPTLRSRSRR